MIISTKSVPSHLLLHVTVLFMFVFSSACATSYFSPNGELTLDFEPNDYGDVAPFAFDFFATTSNSSTKPVINFNGKDVMQLDKNEVLKVNQSIILDILDRAADLNDLTIGDPPKILVWNLTMYDGKRRNRKQTWPIVAYFTVGTSLTMNCAKRLSHFQSFNARYSHNCSEILSWKIPKDASTPKFGVKKEIGTQCTKTTLRIEHLQQKDSGYYTCYEKAEVAEITTKIIVVSSEKDIDYLKSTTNASEFRYVVPEGGNASIYFEYQSRLNSDIIPVPMLSGTGGSKTPRYDYEYDATILPKTNVSYQCESRLLNYHFTLFHCLVKMTLYDLIYENGHIYSFLLNNTSPSHATNVTLMVQPRKLRTALWINDNDGNPHNILKEDSLRTPDGASYVFLELNRSYVYGCILLSPAYGDEAPVARIQFGSIHFISSGNASASWGFKNVLGDRNASKYTDIKSDFSSTIFIQWTASLEWAGAVRCSATGDSEGDITAAILTFTDVIDTSLDSEGGLVMDIVEWNEEKQKPLYSLEERRKKKSTSRVFTAYEGENLTLACRVPNTFMRGQFVLTFPIDRIGDIYERTHPTIQHNSGLLTYGLLKLINLTTFVEKEYTCQLHYTAVRQKYAGSPFAVYKRRPASLKVVRPVGPFFEFDGDYSRKEEKATYDQPFHLICRPSGDPQPVIQWQKNGMLLSNALGSVNLSFPAITAADEGRYSCIVRSRYGQVQKDTILTVTGAPVRSSTIIIVVLIAVSVTAVIGLSGILFRSSNQKKQLVALNNELLTSTSYNVGFEVPPQRLHVDFENRLGEGEFGIVYKGSLTAANSLSQKTVAVKVPKDGKNPLHQAALLDEMKIMMTFSGAHVNVLQLIGACTCNMVRGELYVIIEFCTSGSLQEFLIRENNTVSLVSPEEITYESTETKNDGGYYFMQKISSEPKSTPNSSLCEAVSEEQSASAVCDRSEEERSVNAGDLVTHLSFSYQIANGMDYLGCKMLIHRDLAARNLLLTMQNDVILVKIADYGLARQRSTYRLVVRGDEERLLPVGWMAPEALLQGHYTIKTDCWSFGVVLWEIFTLGENPDSCYEELLPEGLFAQRYERRLADFLQRDGRLRKPPSCPESIFQLMTDCWEMNPDKRPSFAICRDRLQAEVGNRCLSALESLRFGEILALLRCHEDESPVVYNDTVHTCEEEEMSNGNDAIVTNDDFQLTRMNSTSATIDEE